MDDYSKTLLSFARANAPKVIPQTEAFDYDSSGIQVGDKVYSFDFPDQRTECYIVGVVVAFVDWQGCPRYKIHTERKFWAGEEVDVPEAQKIVLPPINGTPTTLGHMCDSVRPTGVRYTLDYVATIGGAE